MNVASILEAMPHTSARQRHPTPVSRHAAHRDGAPDRAACTALASRAIASLHAELMLYPKPGLVSPVDNGSHTDMNASTFLRSLFALRHYFARIARAGWAAAPFGVLKQLGIEAEHTMLRATGGVNTHRGAIFCLGMTCAAIARCHAQGDAPCAVTIQRVLLSQWGDALAQHTSVAGAYSHGQQVAWEHAVGGAREEMARGMPAVFDYALPAMQRALVAGRSIDCARIDALFELMAQISDTNVYYRGGRGGADMVRLEARRFIDAGATSNPDWRSAALRCHRDFVEVRLSPGGAADLLAVTNMVHFASCETQPGVHDVRAGSIAAAYTKDSA